LDISRVMSDVDPQSNSDLVARLRAGDLGAFDDVHRQFHGRLYGFLARLARSRDVAEDLLEETWLRLVAHARQLSPDTQLGPWLFTVARNLHVSYRRSRALEMGHLDDVLGLWPAGVSGPSPFEATAANEMERKLEAALASLPATYREVLLLVGVEGLQPIEAAAVCGISPESLRQRLHRARSLLSRRMERANEIRLPAASEVLP
jgi:RNA polymerase sigma-70 factor (ECF subfamily)